MTAALPVVVRLNAVIVAVTGETPRILTVSSGDLDALPYGPLDTMSDRTLERGLRRWVQEQTGLELGYVEQLYTFGDLHRETGEASQILSVAYLALVREGRIAGATGAHWRDVYAFFPWEDNRDGTSPAIDSEVRSAIAGWEQAAPDETTRQMRRERTAINFGLHGSDWDGYRALERYEQLWEIGLVPEAIRDRSLAPATLVPGEAMVFDHRRIAATALGRLRGKLKYRPVVFELLPDTFTLSQLQGVVEALAGVRLHKQNFRRLVDRGGLVEPTGLRDTQTGGRPAELFRFRRDVLRERPAPGLGLPAVRFTP